MILNRSRNKKQQDMRFSSDLTRVFVLYITPPKVQNEDHVNIDRSNIDRISLPFKDQVSASAVRRQLRDLSHKISPTLQPVFVSRKLEQDLKPKEAKPSIVNQIGRASCRERV